MHIESRGRNSAKGKGWSRSKNRRSRSKNPSNSNSLKIVEWWNCGKTGHYKNQCRSTPKDEEVKAKANVTSTSQGDDTLTCSLEGKEDSWVLDSGASFHVTSQKYTLILRYLKGMSS